jgi:cyclohexanone monooxygenase
MSAAFVKGEAPGRPETLDLAIIGAGFTGMYMLYRARQLGLSTRVFETAPDVGGTWFWNRYPGARCDTESAYYSYSFSEELQQEWPLLERYPAQGQNLAYLKHVADRFDLRRDIAFNVTVLGAQWDEQAAVWRVRTDVNPEIVARFLVTAVGCLSAANSPAFEGLEDFTGLVYHTSRWPADSVGFAGKRVGVIGTGSSGIQSIPEIAKQAEQLTVFQRTPQFSLPARNRAHDPEWVRQLKAEYLEIRKRCRVSPAGTPYPLPDQSALEVSEADRQQAFDAAWAAGGGRLLGTFRDILVDEKANDLVAEYVRAKIREVVRDPDVAATLSPRSYPIGTKRIVLDSGYYETFNRANVRLVDLRKTPIARFTSAGIRTSDEEFPLDIVVFATGFDAITGPLLKLNLVGRADRTLQDAWKDGWKSYLGLATAGFPNLFFMTGPGSPSVLTNMVMSIEQHVEWVCDCLQSLRQLGAATIEAAGEAQARWTDHVAEVAAATLYPRAASWYVGANIDGKPRNFMPYAGGLGRYREICDAVAASGYRGFEIPGRPADLPVSFLGPDLPAAPVPDAG